MQQLLIFKYQNRGFNWIFQNCTGKLYTSLFSNYVDYYVLVRIWRKFKMFDRFSIFFHNDRLPFGTVSDILDKCKITEL